MGAVKARVRRAAAAKYGELDLESIGVLPHGEKGSRGFFLRDLSAGFLKRC